MIRRAIMIVIAPAVTLAALSLIASPALAGCSNGLPLPDGKIRRVGGSYKGQGVIDCAQVPGNRVTRTRSPGGAAKWQVKFRNDEGTPESIRLVMFGDGDASFKYKVKRGNKDITEKLESENGKVFAGVGPGGFTKTLTVRIKARNSASSGETTYLQLSGQYADDPSEFNFDSVFARLVVT